MKKCSQCNALYSDNDMTICPKCGSDLEVVHENKVLAENPTPVTPNVEHNHVNRTGALTYAITALALSAASFGFAWVENWFTNIFFVVFFVIAWIPFGASIRAVGRFEAHAAGQRMNMDIRIMQLLILLVQAGALIKFIL